MAQSEDAADKSHEPSQKKLDDARRKGEIVRSADVNVALSYLGVWLFILSIGASQAADFGAVLQQLLVSAFRWGDELRFGSGTAFFAPFFLHALIPFAFFASGPAVIIVLALLAQRALIFTPSKLAPKLSRISLLQNAKNKFGRGGIFEFCKSFVKMLIYSIALASFVRWNIDLIVNSSTASAKAGLVMLFMLICDFLMIVLGVALCIAAIDYAWQFQEHRRKNMMSHKELRDESKDSEGDPHLKQQRRGRAQEIALNQMMADVPLADVIVVNPTHYAVALKWSGGPHDAPRCVAKGVDEIAMRIRSIAEEARVPIHTDPPTARAIHAVVDIGQRIKPEHYKAVAAAIRFAEQLKSKRKA